jgi:hypothetical protein
LDWSSPGPFAVRGGPPGQVHFLYAIEARSAASVELPPCSDDDSAESEPAAQGAKRGSAESELAMQCAESDPAEQSRPRKCRARFRGIRGGRPGCGRDFAEWHLPPGLPTMIPRNTAGRTGLRARFRGTEPAAQVPGAILRNPSWSRRVPAQFRGSPESALCAMAAFTAPRPRRSRCHRSAGGRAADTGASVRTVLAVDRIQTKQNSVLRASARGSGL